VPPQVDGDGADSSEIEIVNGFIKVAARGAPRVDEDEGVCAPAAHLIGDPASIRSSREGHDRDSSGYARTSWWVPLGCQSART